MDSLAAVRSARTILPLVILLLGTPVFAGDAELAADAIKRGDAFFKSTDLGSAEEAYTEAIRLDPTSAKAYLSRGVTRQKKGDQAGAIRDYTEANPLITLGVMF